MGVIQNTHPTNNIKFKEFEDFYHAPSSTGRVAIHIACEVKTAKNIWVPFEIQVMLQDMEATEDLTRSNYLNAQALQRRADQENRPVTSEEQSAIDSYNNSSIERYTADCRQYGLMNLRRPDLARAEKNFQKQLMNQAYSAPALQLVVNQP